MSKKHVQFTLDSENSEIEAALILWLNSLDKNNKGIINLKEHICSRLYRALPDVDVSDLNLTSTSGNAHNNSSSVTGINNDFSEVIPIVDDLEDVDIYSENTNVNDSDRVILDCEVDDKNENQSFKDFSKNLNF